MQNTVAVVAACVAPVSAAGVAEASMDAIVLERDVRGWTQVLGEGVWLPVRAGATRRAEVRGSSAILGQALELPFHQAIPRTGSRGADLCAIFTKTLHRLNTLSVSFRRERVGWSNGRSWLVLASN